MAAKVTHPRELAEALATWGALTDRAETFYEEAEQLRQDIRAMDEVIGKAIKHRDTIQNRLATASIRHYAAQEALCSHYDMTQTLARRHGYKDAQDASNAEQGITPWRIG